MSQRDVTSWIPNLLGPTDFQVNQTPQSVPKRSTINLVGNASVTDNPANDSTDITINADALIAGAHVSGTVSGQAKELGWNGTSWKPRPSEVRNVLDYGADNTGNVDNTAIFQALLDDTTYGGSQGGTKTIYFPSCITGGFYKITKPLAVHQNYMSLVGDTAFGSIIRSDGVHMPILVLSDPTVWPQTVTSITGSGNSMVYQTGGQADQWIDLRDVSYMADLGSFSALTIECVIQNDATVPSGQAYIYTHSGSYTNAGFINSVEIYLQPGSDGNHSDLKAYLNTSSGGGTLTLADAVVKGVPTYIALVWDGTNYYLFASATGATTSHASGAASGTFNFNPSEGCWVGGGYSLTWPEHAFTGTKFTGKLDSLRISNFARHTTDFTAPNGKFPTDDANNLNVGGSGHNTWFVTNFETYTACWKGYTWAAGGEQICYIANRTNSPNGAITAANIKDLTLQSDLGRACQNLRAIGCNFERLELYGTYGLTFEGDSFYSSVKDVNCYATGPSMAGVSRDPYCVCGFLNMSVDGPVKNIGLFGTFAIGMKISNGDVDFVKVAVNGYTRVPIHYTGSGTYSVGKINNLNVDDENVGFFPNYNGTTHRGNWLCCVYVNEPALLEISSSLLTCETSGDVPVLLLNAVGDSPNAFVRLKSNSLISSTKSGASQAAIKFAGTSPVRPIDIENSFLNGSVPWASSAQSSFLSIDGQNARKITTGTASTGSVYDQVVGINVGTAYNYTTPPAPYAGKTIVIKDQSGAASTNSITITANSGQTIDGASTAVINTDHGKVSLCFDGVSDWMT